MGQEKILSRGGTEGPEQMCPKWAGYEQEPGGDEVKGEDRQDGNQVKDLGQ